MLTEKEYICVTVQNPTIHNTYDDGRYTTFDVELQTNSLSFTLKHSIVQRRYSDFQWLRKTLSRTTGGNPPSLPFGRFFGTFDEDYLHERQKILTLFMQKVVRDTLFVSSAALHLFLQTELSRKDMDALTKEARRQGSMNSVVRAISTYGSRFNRSSTNRSAESISRSTGGTSFSDGLSASLSLPHLGTYVPSLVNLSGSVSLRCETSPNIRKDWDLNPKLVNGVPAKKPLSYEEKDYGEWVVINDSPTVSRDLSSLNPASSSPISSRDYTKVSWKIGDFRGSSEALAPSAAILSRRIPVPFRHRSKDCLFGPILSQSVGATGDPHHLNTPSFVSGLVGKSDLRRVASDSNVSQHHLESNPPSFKSSTTPRKKRPPSDQVGLEIGNARKSSENDSEPSNIGLQTPDLIPSAKQVDLDVGNARKSSENDSEPTDIRLQTPDPSPFTKVLGSDRKDEHKFKVPLSTTETDGRYNQVSNQNSSDVVENTIATVDDENPTVSGPGDDTGSTASKPVVLPELVETDLYNTDRNQCDAVQS